MAGLIQLTTADAELDNDKATWMRGSHGREARSWCRCKWGGQFTIIVLTTPTSKIAEIGCVDGDGAVGRRRRDFLK